MTRRKWTISTYPAGQRRDIDLIVYDTVGQLRGEATKWGKNIGETDPTYSDAQGVCHSFQRIHVDAKGTETEHPLVLIIRLHKGQLTPLVISHEVAHAAQHLYLIDILKGDDQQIAVDHFHAANEDFAHIYGELFNVIWGTLYPLEVT